MSAPYLDLEGRAVPLREGDTIASALYRHGIRVFSRSFKYHRRRGLYCLTGDCPNCLLTVDGEPSVRACMTPAREGQRVERQNAWPSPDFDILAAAGYLRWLLPVGFYYKTFVRPRFAWSLVDGPIRRAAGLGRADPERAPARRESRHLHPHVLVIGGGPAGLAAAHAAADEGLSVVLADEGLIGEKPARDHFRAVVDNLADALRGRSEATILERSVAIGVYEGPLVPVASTDFLHLVHPQRVVVATGAVERHPVFPGNDLVGVLLGRGAAGLAGLHRVRPGRTAVFAGTTAESLGHLETLVEAGVDVEAALVPGHLAAEVSGGIRVIVDGRIEKAVGRKAVRGLVVGGETIGCDHVVVSLGFVPRDGLLRQGSGLPVVGAGDTVRPGCSLDDALESGRNALGAPPAVTPAPSADPPTAGVVCTCEDVEVHDLERAWEEGFRSTELLKRYTTTTMGPCQGALCHPHLCAFVHARSGESPFAARVSARPPARPITLEEAAAGARYHVFHRTALHHRHLDLDAEMEWAGAWQRPSTYGDPLAEYWAVRREVALMDVGTLGKFIVTGPDASAFLERIYPSRVGDLREGAVRYTLLLNEAGAVVDDGVVCSLGREGYYLTFTTGGAEHAEAWLSDWAETWGYRVHVVNQTAALGAVIVSGPRSRELLSRLTENPLGTEELPFGGLRRIEVAGIECSALRLGYVGELSFELHHPSSQSVRLWNALLKAGHDLGAVPYGLEALRTLRLEKAHFIIGQDTEFDTSPLKLGLERLPKMDKEDFVGKLALERLAGLPLRERLAKIRFESEEAPAEGAPLTVGGRHVGRLTSSRSSPLLGCSVALGWIRRVDGGFPARVEAPSAVGEIVETPFYDPDGSRLRA